MEQTQINRAAKSKATRSRNKVKSSAVALAVGAWTGGIIPCLTYDVAHRQAPDLFITPWSPQAALWLVVAGGLVYSAPMVAAWFSRYAGTVKAWGFVISLEVAMTFTSHVTALPALLTLVGINGFLLANKFKND